MKYQGFTAWFDLFFILFFADINFVSKFGSNRCQSFGGCENFLFGCSLVRWCAGAYSFGCLYHILINFSLVEERDRRAFFNIFSILHSDRMDLCYAIFEEKNMMTSSFVLHLNSNSIVYIKLYTVDKELLNTMMICNLKDTQNRARH